MVQNVDAVNRTAMPSPYVNSKQKAQNTKELFDLLRPDRMGGSAAGKQEQAEKAGHQLVEKIRQQLVSSDSSMVAGNLKKFLDAAIMLNNKTGNTVLSDKDIQRMMLKPENLLRELNSQQKGTTIFKGQLFDDLRSLLQQSKFMGAEQQGKIKEAVVDLLRQYANLYVKAQRPNEGAEQKQMVPQDKKGGENTGEAVFKKAETLLHKAVDKLSEALKPEGAKFAPLLTRLEALKPETARMIMNQIIESQELQQHSSLDKVLDVILAKLEESTGNDTVKLYGEQIVRGLLNTNTMNQPVLHFILPLLFENMSAFAEMWVDPDAENPNGDGKGGKATRVFLTADLEEKGKAEIDVILSNNKVYVTLYHPEEMTEQFSEAKRFITLAVQNAGFTIGNISVEVLQDAHLIEDIIGKPLERRMTLDAKV